MWHLFLLAQGKKGHMQLFSFWLDGICQDRIVYRWTSNIMECCRNALHRRKSSQSQAFRDRWASSCHSEPIKLKSPKLPQPFLIFSEKAAEPKWISFDFLFTLDRPSFRALDGKAGWLHSTKWWPNGCKVHECIMSLQWCPAFHRRGSKCYAGRWPPSQLWSHHCRKWCNFGHRSQASRVSTVSCAIRSSWAISSPSDGSCICCQRAFRLCKWQRMTIMGWKTTENTMIQGLAYLGNIISQWCHSTARLLWIVICHWRADSDITISVLVKPCIWWVQFHSPLISADNLWALSVIME